MISSELLALTDSETLGVVLNCLTEHISIETQGACDQKTIAISFKKLYLDRGFFSISVIRWLQILDILFIMPAVRRGKKGGINQFLKVKRSYKTTYTLTKSKDDFVKFELGSCRTQI